MSMKAELKSVSELTPQNRAKIEKILEKNGIPPDKIDIYAYYDNNLTLEENIKLFRNTFKLSKDILNIKIEQEKYLEQIAEMERSEIQRRFEEIVQQIKSESADISNFYGNLPNFVNMIINGYSNSLFVIGSAGTGKTVQIQKMLPIERLVKIGGHLTPKKLWETLRNNSVNKILYFDDVEDILADKTSLALLKQALDTNEPRVVAWETSTQNLEPFELKSSVIFCCNSIPDDISMKAIISRSNKCVLNFNYYEILQLMYCIAQKGRKVNGYELIPEIRMIIVDFIKENSSPATENFSLRTQYHIENFYIYSKGDEKWKEMAKELLDRKDETLEIVMNLANNGKSVSEQIREFHRLTSKSRATYYRLRKMVEFSHDKPIMSQNLISN